MSQKVRIALDAMGGDHGPSIVVPGAELALMRHPDSEYLLYGDRTKIEPFLAAHPRLKDAARLVHTEVAVRMEDKPSQALRNGRWKSSMWLALDAVKRGEADVAISAGNTGALMAMAKFNLKTLPGIDRPAIAGLWPTLKGECIVLDLGASIGADAEHLLNLAVMGSAMARVLFHLDGRASACSTSASRRSRDSSRCARPAASCAKIRRRTSNMSASSRAMISARARPTWW
jgi:glycerol-3-phosphate acyltransferase PlsX